MSYNALAISGDPCSGKTKLIDSLAQILGWERVSIGSLFRTRFQAWKEHAKNISSKEKDFDYWWAKKVSDSDIYQVNIDARERLASGKIILDSRYVPENTRGLSNVVSLFLTAPLEVRAQRALGAGRYPGLKLRGEGGVMESLDSRSKEEYRRGLELFNLDYRNPQGYHMVLNTSKLTIPEEINQVLFLLHQKD